MELKGTLHYDRLKFKKTYDMPILEENVFQDITDFIMENRLGNEFFDIIGVDYLDTNLVNDKTHIRSLVESEIDEFQVTLGEHFPDTTFTIDEAYDIYCKVEDIDEELVVECLTHVISNTKQLINFNFDDYYLVDVDNDYDLGEYVIDSMGGFECLSRDIIERYFDFEKYGRDIRLEGSAIDCDGKYLMGG